jgi:hypothetical protein
MDTLTKKYLTAIRDAAKTILRDQTENLALHNYWTCNEMSDICTDLGLTHYIKRNLIDSLGYDFIRSQLCLEYHLSAFLNDWCDINGEQPWHSENLKYWRIVWLNFVINRCGQYLRGDLKLRN